MVSLRALCNRQFVIFVAVGIVCTLVDVGLLYLLSSNGTNVMLATTVGFAASLAMNFALHLRVTFAATWSQKTYWRYLTIVALHYFVTLAFVAVSVEFFSDPLPGKILSLPLIAVNGFFLSKHWVFK